MKNGLESYSKVGVEETIMKTKKDYDECFAAENRQAKEENIHFRIKIPCSNRQAKFRWFPIFVCAFEARFFVASFHSPAGFFFPLWNAFLLFVDILYFRLYGTQKSFSSASNKKYI